jgi:hypothetical protein
LLDSIDISFDAKNMTSAVATSCAEMI